MTQYSRRQFLGAIGAGAVATTGLAGVASAQEVPVVTMGNNYFDPVGLFVEPGTTVRFDLAAGVHSATAYADRIPDGATVFDSGTISQGSFEHTFETPGTYDYYCIPHQAIGMVGRIVVGRAGGPAEDSSIPDGEVPTSAEILDRGTVAYGSTSDGTGNTDGGMMGPGGGGMMGPNDGGRMNGPNGGGTLNDQNGGWIAALPLVGGLLGLLGLAGGALYAIGKRGAGPGGDDDSARALLRRRYARGELDEEEFKRRRDRLADGDERLVGDGQRDT